MSTKRFYCATIAAGLLLTPLVSFEAFAASRAMQICTAKWNAHLATLPAPPPPGSNAKSKFIKDCMAHTSNTPTSASTTSHTITGTTGSPVVTDPPDPERTTTTGGH